MTDEAIGNKTRFQNYASTHNEDLLFDVSDDSATGQLAAYGIIKISGTNLIQQTDSSIARYHVPVTLFDHGSGSRAAFASFWLYCMGYTVKLAYLDEPIVIQRFSVCHNTWRWYGLHVARW